MNLAYGNSLLSACLERVESWEGEKIFKDGAGVSEYEVILLRRLQEKERAGQCISPKQGLFLQSIARLLGIPYEDEYFEENLNSKGSPVKYADVSSQLVECNCDSCRIGGLEMTGCRLPWMLPFEKFQEKMNMQVEISNFEREKNPRSFALATFDVYIQEDDLTLCKVQLCQAKNGAMYPKASVYCKEDASGEKKWMALFRYGEKRQKDFTDAVMKALSPHLLTLRG